MKYGAQTKFATAIKSTRQRVNALLKGRRNTSKAEAQVIVAALGGDPEDLNQLECWREGGAVNVAARRAAVEGLVLDQ